ncbi:hypothetical protein MKW92_053389, partial [Papaver armeniacum]
LAKYEDRRQALQRGVELQFQKVTSRLEYINRMRNGDIKIFVPRSQEQLFELMREQGFYEDPDEGF